MQEIGASSSLDAINPCYFMSKVGARTHTEKKKKLRGGDGTNMGEAASFVA